MVNTSKDISETLTHPTFVFQVLLYMYVLARVIHAIHDIQYTIYMYNCNLHVNPRAHTTRSRTLAVLLWLTRIMQSHRYGPHGIAGRTLTHLLTVDTFHKLKVLPRQGLRTKPLLGLGIND